MGAINTFKHILGINTIEVYNTNGYSKSPPSSSFQEIDALRVPRLSPMLKSALREVGVVGLSAEGGRLVVC